jgi:hypothetical protein
MHKRTQDWQAGISMIEVLIASTLMMICSLSLMALIGSSIASNTRNKFDSTTTMLVQSVVEQIAATVVGSGTSTLTDCNGTAWAINTAPGGATVTSSDKIDFTQSSPPTNYRMLYVVKSPCTSAGIEQAVYDVRWNVQLVGSGVTATNTFLLTVSGQMQDRGQGNKYFAAPVTIRALLGN